MAKIETDVITKIFTQKCQEILVKYEDDIIDRIAFSMFAMCHYRHILYRDIPIPILEQVLNELHIEWIRGKEENKVSYFILLAKRMFKLKLEKKKDNLKDGNN